MDTDEDREFTSTTVHSFEELLDHYQKLLLQYLEQRDYIEHLETLLSGGNTNDTLN